MLTFINIFFFPIYTKQMEVLFRVSRQHLCLLRTQHVIRRDFAAIADAPLKLNPGTPSQKPNKTLRNPPRPKRKRSFWRRLLGIEDKEPVEAIPKPELKQDAISPLSDTTRGPLRPMMGTKAVNEEHPLYAFFRQTRKRSYTILEAPGDQDESSKYLEPHRQLART